jgi:hypothetical protein
MRDLGKRSTNEGRSNCKFLVFFCFGDQNIAESPSLNSTVNKGKAFGCLKMKEELKWDEEKNQMRFAKQSNKLFDKIAKKSKMEEEEFRRSLEICEMSYVHFLFITSSLEQIKGEKMLKLVKTAKRSKLVELTRTKMKMDKKESSLCDILDFF